MGDKVIIIAWWQPLILIVGSAALVLLAVSLTGKRLPTWREALAALTGAGALLAAVLLMRRPREPGRDETPTPRARPSGPARPTTTPDDIEEVEHDRALLEAADSEPGDLGSVAAELDDFRAGARRDGLGD